MLLLRYAAFSFLKAAVSIVFVLANFLSILQLAIYPLLSAYERAAVIIRYVGYSNNNCGLFNSWEFSSKSSLSCYKRRSSNKTLPWRVKLQIYKMWKSVISVVLVWVSVWYGVCKRKNEQIIYQNQSMVCSQLNYRWARQYRCAAFPLKALTSPSLPDHFCRNHAISTSLKHVVP